MITRRRFLAGFSLFGWFILGHHRPGHDKGPKPSPSPSPSQGGYALGYQGAY